MVGLPTQEVTQHDASTFERSTTRGQAGILQGQTHPRGLWLGRNGRLATKDAHTWAGQARYHNIV